ncbi:hypothetical protein ADL28_22840 [Streptomyces violaceusniger]|uniref:Uncharacterized protein n=2 Tax=Streptomyces violaceusniger group TaxID=2839105 RepID=A0ABD5J3B3_9ACTN|nr:hypothetical protein [Streptomyces violaceusniger]KUL54869.1 hypothetical protein ADL28_22840 [Streptomyces violaceusniger]MEE4582832.1 hypothetical protein [Streptomyces sp. DSM 41602]
MPLPRAVPAGSSTPPRAALMAGATTLSALPASAVAGNADYGTPAIKPAASYLSGAVGATGDPAVTVKAGQSGADADELTVSATATTHGSVTETGDVSSYQGLREDLVDRDKANRDRLGFAKGTADGQVPEQIDGSTSRAWSSRPAPAPPHTSASGRRRCRPP